MQIFSSAICSKSLNSCFFTDMYNLVNTEWSIDPWTLGATRVQRSVKWFLCHSVHI
jgi:hypothetical protein